MRQQGHDVEDGWSLGLANTYRQIFCFLVVNLIAGSLFVGEQVRYGVV